MKLYYATPSPYSAKVRMAAYHIGLDYEPVPTKTGPDAAELMAANPLGKIPTLVLPDGTAVYDSRAIMQELNRQVRNGLFPSLHAKRQAAERLEALADGMCDAMLAIVYDRRMRPEEKQHEPWQETQWEKVERALNELERNPPRVTSRLHGGHFALAAALGYAELRHADRNWSRGRPKLRRFLNRFAQTFPAWEDLRPH